MDRVTAIIRIKTTLPEYAADVLAIYGEGGRPDAEQSEAYLFRCNTPEQMGHVRVLIPRHVGLAMEHVESVGGSDHAELIAVEWDGQQEYLLGETEPMEIDGVTIPAQPVYLGVFA